ncbi:MAG TPA: hypothetical protein VM841_14320 [Actinomycetota bacterium]|nr:hypothetical protein [Actinomycetota bacterium]
MKRLLLALAAVALLVPAAAPAATDVAAVGQGNGTIKVNNLTCAAPLAVTLNVRSNVGVVTENWGPGNPSPLLDCIFMPVFGQYEADNTPVPPVQQCVQGAGLSTGMPYVLSQSGSTYTFTGSTRLCNGKQVLDRVSITVQTTRLVYSHTWSENGVAIVTVNANIPRLA